MPQARDTNQQVVSRVIRPGASRNITYTSSSTPDSTVVSATVVRLVGTTNCWVNVNGVANTTTSVYLPANTELLLGVSPGIDRIAAIQDSAGGTLNITELP